MDNRVFKYKYRAHDASWFNVLIAKIFGLKQISHDFDEHYETTLTGYWWNGRLYLTDCQQKRL